MEISYQLKIAVPKGLFSCSSRTNLSSAKESLVYKAQKNSKPNLSTRDWGKSEFYAILSRLADSVWRIEECLAEKNWQTIS